MNPKKKKAEANEKAVAEEAVAEEAVAEEAVAEEAVAEEAVAEAERNDVGSARPNEDAAYADPGPDIKYSNISK
jgi:hypothetical protein